MSDLVTLHGEALLRLASASIRYGLDHGKPLPTRSSAYPKDLSVPGAAFVTLEKAGNLRGCIGSPMAWRSLLEDVADNAFKAAFGDPRFPNLQAQEIGPDLTISVSVLTPPVPLPFTDRADLLKKLRPGVDGLILQDQGRRGLFLPQVWDSLPTPEEFLAHLVQKAGLPAGYWSPTVTLQRFEAHAAKSKDVKGIWG